MNTRDKTYEVYGLVDVREPDRIRYVGLTTQTAQKRLFGHWKLAESQVNPRFPVHKWMKKRTRSQIQIRVLGTYPTKEAMIQGEINFIAHYRSLDQADLNITAGGEGAFGLVHTDEFKAALSERMLGSQGSHAPRPGVAVANSRRTQIQKNHQAEAVGKITAEDVRMIRKLYLMSLFSQKELAFNYGVTPGNVWSIVNNKTWKHLL